MDRSPSSPRTVDEQPVLTFLLTDIEGSTELWNTRGEAMALAVQRHDELIAGIVAANGGELVKAKGEGDSTFAVFGGPDDAVAAAAEAQAALSSDVHDDGVCLRVRMALATGSAQQRDDDYFGVPVNRAARLRSLANGGEILLAAATSSLLGNVPDGYELVDLGAHHLRGFQQPEQVSELRPAGVTSAPADAPAVPRAMASVAASGAFVGRETELESLRAFLGRAWQGDARLSLISGEPGIGKTRLAAELVAAAHAQGVGLLYGRCDEELSVPYQPFLQALQAFVATCSDQELRRRLGPHAGELVRLLPDLPSRVPGLPVALQSDPASERYRLYEAVAGWLTAASQVRPLLVVVDDLQWAAAPTLDLLRHVVRSVEAAKLAIVAIHRSVDLADPIATFLADLRREDGVERVQLSGLERDQVVDLLAGSDVADDDIESIAVHVHAETAGNPFFVREVERHLLDLGALSQGPDGRRTGDRRALRAERIPDGVRDVLRTRLARLSQDAIDMLEVAAVIGADFDYHTLLGATVLTAEACEHAVAAAVGAGIIVPVDPTALRYRFSHVITRATVYDATLAPRRARIHRRVAETIEEGGEMVVDAHLAELAWHYTAAAALGTAAQAIDCSARAGGVAAVQFAWDDAAAHFDNALHLLGTGPGERSRRAELLTALGQSQRNAGDTRCRATLREAAALAREGTDPGLFALVVVEICRTGGTYWDVDHEAVGLTEEALTALGPTLPTLRARLLAEQALALLFDDDAERRERLSRESVAIARATGDPDTLGYALLLRDPVLTHPRALSERVANMDEFRRLNEQSGDRSARYYPAFRGALLAMELGDVTAMTQRLDEADRVVAEAALGVVARYDLDVVRAARSRAEGRLEDGERQAEAAYELGRSIDSPDSGVYYGMQIFFLRLDQGRLGELVEGIQTDLSTRPAPLLEPMLAFALGEVGRNDEAQAVVDGLAPDGFARVPYGIAWLTGIGLLAETCSTLRDADRCAVLHDLLEPFSELCIASHSHFGGSVVRCVGLLDAVLGQLDEADEHFARGVEIDESMGAVAYAARGRLGWAHALLTRRGPGDVERARELVAAAADAGRTHRIPAIERTARVVSDRL